MNRMTLGELVNLVDEIPIFPDMISRILELTENPETTIKEIEKEILKDQGLTAKVLKIANSAYYGVSRKISTVSEATILLGFQAIKSIVLTASVSKLLVTELHGYALKREELWRQSQICALTNRMIAKKVKYKNIDQAYIAGLMRDIGKVALDHNMTKQYEKILDMVEKEQKPFMEIEEKVFGFHHGQVGAKIAEKWKLPEDLVEAIAFHHTPEKAIVNKQLVAMTHISDSIVMMLGLHIGSDGLAYNFSQEAIELLGLNDEDLHQIMSEVADAISDEKTFL